MSPRTKYDPSDRWDALKLSVFVVVTLGLFLLCGFLRGDAPPRPEPRPPLAPAGPEAANYEGDYRTEGVDAAGQAYRGVLQLRRRGAGYVAYHLVGEGHTAGTCLVRDGRLFVAWHDPSAKVTGLTVLNPRCDGFEGQWATASDGINLRPERWTILRVD